MKNKSRIIGAAIVAATMASVSAQAATITWDGGAADGGVYTNAINWTGDVLPGGSDIADMNTTDTILVEDGHTNSVQRHYIRSGATLNMTGGKLNGTQSGNVRDIVGGGSGHSYLNQSGGFYQSSHILRIGEGALGTVNLSGGCEMTVTRGNAGITGNGSTSLQIDNFGTLNITNATLTTRTGLEIDSGGQLYVHGGFSAIGIGGTAHTSDGDFFMASNAVLKVGISTNGLSPIEISNDSAVGDSTVILGAGAILDVSFVDGFVAETNIWPVIDNSEGVSFNNLGMVLEPSIDTNDWGFIVSNNVLYVGYGQGWPQGGDVLGPPASQRTLYWTGAGGDTASDNPTNWVLDTAATVTTDWGPYDNDNWRIADVAVTGVNLGTNYEVDYDGTAIFNQRDMEVGVGAQGTLNWNSGALSFTSHSSGRQEFGLNPGGDGTLNMNADTLTLNAVRFGVAGGQGTLNLNGGTFNIERGYGDISLWLGHGGSSTGTLNAVGGRMFTRGPAKLGDTALAIGIFNVEGSVVTDLGIGVNGTLDGGWEQNSGSILKCRVDAGGLTTIVIDDNNDTIVDGVWTNQAVPVINFKAGSILDIGWMPSVTNYSSFDVMTWQAGELEGSNLAFAASVDTNIWSFAFVDDNSDGTNDTLRATAYGETANGTPYGWLNQYGLDDTDDDIDNDMDGLLTWEEYIAGTIPTNDASTLVVNSVESIAGGDYVVSWQSVEGKKYSIETNLSLTVGTPGTAASDIVGMPVETSYTSSIPAADALFFEIGVTKD